jgi:hypothetical protein
MKLGDVVTVAGDQYKIVGNYDTAIPTYYGYLVDNLWDNIKIIKINRFWYEYLQCDMTHATNCPSVCLNDDPTYYFYGKVGPWQ